MDQNAIGNLCEEDLVRALGRDTLAKGRRVWAGGAVRSLEVSADGSRLTSTVQTERKGYGPRAPYRQTIALTMRNDRPYIVGYCSCPIGHDCKHVAAALLEHLARGDHDGLRGAGAIPGKVGPPATGRAALGPPPLPPQARDRSAAASSPPVEPATPTVPETTLSDAVAQWLERLDRAAGETAEPAERKPDATNQRTLLYVLGPRDLPAAVVAQHVVVRPVSVRLGKDGGATDPKPYPPENVLRHESNRARYLSPEDLAILPDLAWLQRSGDLRSAHDVVLPANASGRHVLDALIATGRLHWGAIDGPVLSAGPTIDAVARWTTDANGRQKLGLVPAGATKTVGFDAVLPLAPLQYVDAERGLTGRLATGLPGTLALEIARAPVIGPGEASLVSAMLQRLGQRGSVRGAGTPAQSQPTDATEAPPAHLLPLPEAAEAVEVRRVAPTPHLRLAVAPAQLAPHFRYYLGHRDLDRLKAPFRLPVVELAFDYAGERVAAGDPRPRLERREPATLIVTPRDTAFETMALERLRSFGLAEIAQSLVVVEPPRAGALFLEPDDDLDTFGRLVTLDEPTRFIAFVVEIIPRLEADGWIVEFADDYPYRVAKGEIGWWADIGSDADGPDAAEKGSGIDWFSFDVGIEFEGTRVNLVPMLTSILERLPSGLGAGGKGKRRLEEALVQVTLFQELPDGRLLPIPGARLAPLVHGLLDLVGPRHEMLAAGKVRLNRAEAPALADFAKKAGADLVMAESAARLVELGRILQKGRPRTTITPPKSFNAKLRPYQAQGLAWMDFLRESNFGGVLADDMGLGKTVQALALLAREKAAGRLDKPALIVAPTSVLPNWLAEGKKFAPDLKMLALRGPDRQMLFPDIATHDIVLTTYPLLVRDAGTLNDHEFHVAILDEAQAIKNPKAAVSEIAHKINARHRLALTGTPLENNLGEVWSLFQFLSPGLLGDATTFKRLFRTPIEKHGDKAAQAFLSKRLKPFMLRRTKEEVAPELPPKTEITELVRLDGGQRDLYETVRVLMEKRVRDEIDKKGLAKSHIVFLDALLKLRQVCCDPRLLRMPQGQRVKESAKLERLMDMVPEMLAEGRRILLFSQFTSMLALIEAELNQRKIPYVLLTGETKDRAEPVARFQAGEVPLFLISLKAGGTGLNLTAADTVIHYDPWWNPAVERQATDRAYRIGQDKPVFVYRLIAEEGIEQAIEILKARKAALAEALFEGSAKTLSDLTEADVSALFAPLSPAASPPRRKAA